ncbi:MAG: ABC transporter ATP-binding protein [Burkholderiales bacterium]
MSASLLSVRNLRAWYGRAQILYDLDFEVARGEVVALMGRNGAGKSTTFKALMGLLDRAEGEIVFDGLALRGQEPYRIARVGLGYVPEDRRIYAGLSVMENLEVGKQTPRANAPHWTAEKLFQLFPNLGEMRDRPGGQMSGGEQQMLTVARTLMGNPLLVLLDEPSEGLAPKIVEDMANTILELKKEGLSVMLSEQNLHFARLVCDCAYLIEKGQVRFAGSMAELEANEDVRRAYLTI